MPVKIYSTDTVYEIADKIYEHFQPGDMVAIYGFVEVEGQEKIITKGEAVVQRLTWLYEHEYYGHGGRARDYTFKAKSVGGPIAHPIFTWDKKIVDSEPRVIIWRFQ